MYEATAQVLIKVGNTNASDPMRGEKNTPVFIQQEEVVNSEKELIRSRALAKQVIEEIGFEKFNRKPERKLEIIDSIANYVAEKKAAIMGWQRNLFAKNKTNQPVDSNDELNKAVEKFIQSLEIENIRRSNLINISYRHQSPEVAAEIVNRLVANYIERHLEIYETQQSSSFFLEQANLIKNRMQKTEKELIRIKSINGITSFKEEQTLLLQQKAKVEDELNKALSSKIETQNRIAAIDRHLNETPQSIEQGEEKNQNALLINTLEGRLVELQIREKELTTKYSDQSRMVKSVREEIAIVKTKLSEIENKMYEKNTQAINPNYQHLQRERMENRTNLVATIAKIKSLENQYTSYVDLLEKMNSLENSYENLKRQYDIDQKNYTLYLSKYEESRIYDAMGKEKITNVKLSEPAFTPIYPRPPSKKFILLLAFGLGIFGGIFLILSAEYLQQRTDNPEDIERLLDCPVLVSVPDYRKRGA
jgi:uncharacterized protein involved in exopolysaccharide biosynthesis